ncbi:MAG: threonine aldolase family protein, partial [Desulfovermiculus sp.]
VMKIEGLKLSSKPRNHFASDNNSPVHPAVVQAILSANQGHALAYGDDYYTQRAADKLKDVFETQCDPFFVFTGTGANVLCVSALTRSYQAVICAENAHVNGAECGAAEKFAGIKLLPIPTRTGKFTPEDMQSFLLHAGDQHHVQPKVVSLTQATDLGLYYSVEELKELCTYAHRQGLAVHMDGARLYTACAAAGVSLAEMTARAGLDALSLGGTKNGLMGAEAVLFFRPELAEDFKYIRKQGMQLPSKMRFLAVQMEALFTDQLWLTNARHANRMASLLEEELRQIPEIEVTREVQTNMVYCTIPPQAILKIREHYLFYVFDPGKSEVRLVTNYDTREEDIHGFVQVSKKALAGI